METPPTIGLTGGVAAGKTTALEILEELGAATISADALVHRLLDTEPMIGVLRDRWGERVLDADGRVDRSAVGSIVFKDHDELEWLEQQVHPLVGAEIRQWLAGVPPHSRAAAAEIPLLFEGEMESLFDMTVAVVSADSVRAERAAARGTGLHAEREGRQLPQAAKAERADHVISNEGTRDELREALSGLLDRLARSRA